MVFECAIIPSASSKSMARPGRMKEASPMRRDAEQDLPGRESVGNEMAYSRRTGCLFPIHRVQLCVVSAPGAPWAEEVVSHQVKLVQVFPGLGKVDVLQDHLTRR